MEEPGNQWHACSGSSHAVPSAQLILKVSYELTLQQGYLILSAYLGTGQYLGAEDRNRGDSRATQLLSNASGRFSFCPGVLRLTHPS
jgi:hypothetical protein